MNYEVADQHTEPGRQARLAQAPEWVLNGPTAPIIQGLNPDGMVYQHQALGLEAIGKGSNLVISTGTASGKSLIFQAGVLDLLRRKPDATAVAIYPLKALSRDQMSSWRRMAPMAGVEAEAVNKIDGDINIEQRAELLRKSRLAVVTPDIVHSWLLNYSNGRRSGRLGVNETLDACRRFIHQLVAVVIDEAHIYETAFGANMAFLMRRLRAKHRELNPSAPSPLFIAASATVLNPAEHLQSLTGLPFSEITEQDNGAPKAPLTIQHIIGRTAGAGAEQDMTDLIRQILREDPNSTYIAYADDRQKVERIAASVEPTELIHEEDIINESQNAMSYRAGLQARELIEEQLRNGTIRGVVSTSALEMGIDIPELNVGINLGLPNTIKRTRQRAGRVGRTSPGRFIILEQPHAFQYDVGGLRGYWEREIEPANLYLTNAHLQRIQEACLRQELDDSRTIPDMNWPGGFAGTAMSSEEETAVSPADPRDTLRTLTKEPHRNSMRSIDEMEISAYVKGNNTRPLTTMSKVEAMKEMYTWATYHHAKRAYKVARWSEEGTSRINQPHTMLIPTNETGRRTSPMRETSARILLENSTRRISPSGTLGYARSNAATGLETITGVTHTALSEQDGTPMREEYLYAGRGVPDITREVATDMTFIAIGEEWFEGQRNRETVINALMEIMCHQDNVALEEIMTAHSNVSLQTGDGTVNMQAVALWDRAVGGLGLAKTLYDNLPKYVDRLQEIAENPMGRPESTMPLPLELARKLRHWTLRLPQDETKPRPVENQGTEYAGTTFRNRLDAMWACHFDSVGVRWDYQPRTFGNWSPEFRLEMDRQSLYAQVAPVEYLPREIAAKIDASDCATQAMILGMSPDHQWLRANGHWKESSILA